MKILLSILLLILPLVTVNAQSYRLVGGYEQTETRNAVTVGRVEKTARIFSGGNVFNKYEVVTKINPILPYSESNSWVNAIYAWGYADTSGLHLTRYITYTCNPTATTHVVIWDVPLALAPSNVPQLPDTRIDNSYTVVNGVSYWSYCRSTWQLTNVQLQDYYFPFRYQLADGRFVNVAYRINSFESQSIVIRWEDFRLDNGVPIGTPGVNAVPPALGPYFSFMQPTPINELFPPLFFGTSGSYYTPTAPTPKATFESFLNFFYPFNHNH